MEMMKKRERLREKVSKKLVVVIIIIERINYLCKIL